MNEDCFIRTGTKEFDELIPLVRSFLEKDVQEVFIDGEKIRGYRSPDTPSIWIRDYSDMLRGIRYFEKDVKSAVQHFADTQAVNGRVFDYFTTNPEKLPCERENWTKYVRVPVEADVEYRFIKAAFLAWQACGDDEWIRSLMPNMDLALQYAFTHPHRIDEDTGLVKRPYTIDTWDFAYTAGKHDWLQFQIDNNTFWGIFHGDISGFYEALKIMSYLSDYFEQAEEASRYNKLAERIKRKCNELCWNGSFYTHFVKLNPCDISACDEESQLSMSNPMAINRGMTDSAMARSIIEEYQSRRLKKDNYFAEWYSIDPPFPDGVFGDEKLIGGAYINGGIFPLAGGELAKAAFYSGFEEYGVDILRRYYQLLKKHDGSWLWYFPDGSPSTAETSTSPEATSTDGWGSTAMLNALIGGLAGIEDLSKQFREINLSPRWASAQIAKAHVRLSYPSSKAFIEYKYEQKESVIRLEVNSLDTRANIHLLLPGGKRVSRVEFDGVIQRFEEEKSGSSLYINFKIRIKKSTTIIISLDYEKE